MAAPKQQKVTEKQTGSDEKIRGLSLYFLQGRALRFEGFDWLEFAQGLHKLSDAEKLERFDELGRKFRNPTIAVYTQQASRSGEPETRHQNMNMTSLGSGVYLAGVPVLYKDDGPPEYEVCGAIIPARSWSTSLHNEWDAFMDEKNLKQLTKEFNDLSEQINEELPSSEDIRTKWKQLPGLEDSRDALVTMEQEAFADLSKSDEDLERIGARLKLVTEKIEGIKAEQKRWSQDNDPFEAEVAVHPLGKKLKAVELQTQEVYLEFVHRLASRDGQTTDDFETWRRDATQQDLSNAAEVVATGNGSWTSGQASQAQTPEQKQQRAYDSLS